MKIEEVQKQLLQNSEKDLYRGTAFVIFNNLEGKY